MTPMTPMTPAAPKASMPSSPALTRRSMLALSALACASVASARLLGPASPARADQAAAEPASAASASTPLVPRPLPPLALEQNPYLPAAESMIHNDVYNSDVTARPVPLGINPEIVEQTVEGRPICPPALYFDACGNAVIPYSVLTDEDTSVAGGIAICDLTSPTLEVTGSYMPAFQEPDAPYGIQISYSFVDARNNLVGPTNTGRVAMFRTTDEAGTPLPLFEKVFDVDVVSPALAAVGDDVDRNLMSIVYDYDGNLWFTTGGFRIDPAVSAAGFAGYLERAYIDQALARNGGNEDPAPYLHYHRYPNPGENCENGIAGHRAGCVVLTNQACYLLGAGAGGVEVRWEVPYDTEGPKLPPEDSEITGIGLAWGGGSSPTLTGELALFTDNRNPVNLIAVELASGEVVASTPVLDLGPDVVVSVENSICVYSAGPDQAIVLVCNWFGAGSPKLLDPQADSSVQSYDNLYDANWRAEGSRYLMPGVTRVDVLRNEDGTYRCETVWTRADLRDTSMIKLSTATGYFHGYTQDLETGTWGFFALDRDTGETALWLPVSSDPAYNNAAVGIMQANDGNTLYCPTNSQTMVSVKDRFAALARAGATPLDIDGMVRERVDDARVETLLGTGAQALGYLLSARVDSWEDADELAFLVNGLEGTANELVLLERGDDGTLAVSETPFALADASGAAVAPEDELAPDVLYELHVPLPDPADAPATVRVLLARAAR